MANAVSQSYHISQHPILPVLQSWFHKSTLRSTGVSDRAVPVMVFEHYLFLTSYNDCEIYIPDSWHWHVADTTWQDNDIHRNHMNHMNIQSQRRLCYVVVTYHTNTNYWHDSDCDFLTEFAAYLAYCDTETEVASGFSRWWWRQRRWRITRSIELCSITRGQGPLQQYRKTSKSKTFSLSKSKSVQSDRPWQTHMIHET